MGLGTNELHFIELTDWAVIKLNNYYYALQMLLFRQFYVHINAIKITGFTLCRRRKQHGGRMQIYLLTLLLLQEPQEVTALKDVKCLSLAAGQDHTVVVTDE